MYDFRNLLHIYDNTPEDSKLRTLLVNIAAESFGFDAMKNNADLFPKEFLIDVILRSQDVGRFPGDLQDKDKFLEEMASQMCTYHDHDHPHSPTV